MSSLFLLLLGLLVGALAAYGYVRSRVNAASEAERAALRAEQARVQAEGEAARLQHARSEGELLQLREAHRQLAQERASAAEQGRALQGELLSAREQLAGAQAELRRERAAGEDKLAVLQSARAELTHQFQVLAAEILEEKTRRFTDHNKANLEGLLVPLREKMGEFQARVESLHVEGVKGQTELRTQINDLRAMNDRLSVDANNLVRALKGSSKTQGDWGEVVLATLLEAAGMQEGREYRMQETFSTEEGRHVRPDVILDLPKGKHLVIDSKVSLTSYAEYCACEDDEERTGYLDRHTRSLRDHIDGLNKKGYQALHQLQSLDFVIMFVPVEPAYLLALAHDGGLWQRAWSKDVLLVSPSTLYPVLRTIQYAWQNERQGRNIEEILQKGTALYDKVAVFATTFEKLGSRIRRAQDSYEEAYGQLATGRGNVLAKVEELKQKGVRATKQIPPRMLAEALAPEMAGDLFPEMAADENGAEASLDPES